MIKVGITGGIGSGKSFISEILESYGYPVFYSDQAAKDIISNDDYARQELISYFGDDVFENNQLNKPFLAKIIFNDEEALQKVNALIHPLVRKAFDLFATQQHSKFVFNEAAILFESGGAIQMDKVVLVTASTEVRIKRVMKRDRVSKEDVLARMSKQWPDEKKEKLSDFIIVNDEEKPLLGQIEYVLDSL